ncbi:MAG TPA: hypothetical protein DGT23_32105 [Micromonosporaceae bacterium]|nr:hypothetical protein [Micromonosporaceae bacterium]
MLYWGCFGEAAVDCLSPAGTVLMHESDVDEVSPDQAWKVDAASLEVWWETWLAGETTTPTQIWRR